ncbi:MAG TPA: hypothetical protein PLF40_20595, partial [Kofleriaceae bacterium]|nr:hypothetical protein [Kofleriaceae bacterium]
MELTRASGQFRADVSRRTVYLGAAFCVSEHPFAPRFAERLAERLGGGGGGGLSVVQAQDIPDTFRLKTSLTG